MEEKMDRKEKKKNGARQAGFWKTLLTLSASKQEARY